MIAVNYQFTLDDYPDNKLVIQVAHNNVSTNVKEVCYDGYKMYYYGLRRIWRKNWHIFILNIILTLVWRKRRKA
jgi:hypothetical protein